MGLKDNMAGSQPRLCLPLEILCKEYKTKTGKVIAVEQAGEIRVVIKNKF